VTGKLLQPVRVCILGGLRGFKGAEGPEVGGVVLWMAGESGIRGSQPE